jgi:hypothetical protein
MKVNHFLIVLLIRDLEREGFLKSVKMGREELYLNYQLMEILEKQ